METNDNNNVVEEAVVERGETDDATSQAAPRSLKGFKFLVTGGTGFLGLHLIKLLLKHEAEVVVLARSEDPELERFTKRKIEIFKGSISEYDSVLQAAEGVHGIFHLAGLVAHTRKPEASNAMYETNVEGSINVMKVAVEKKCRVVYISTSGVVGCSKDRTAVADDNSPYCTSVIKQWPYYTTKMEAEIQVKEMADRHGVEVVILRPSVMLGPGDARFRSTHTILKFLDRKVPFIPSGVISFVDVRDVAECCLAGMIRENKTVFGNRASGSSTDLTSSTSPVGKTFLLGTVNWSMLEFFTTLERISGVKKPMLKSIPPAITKPLLSVLNQVKDSSIVKKLKKDKALQRPAQTETSREAHAIYNGVLKPPVEAPEEQGWDPVRIEMAAHNWSIRAVRAGTFLGFAPRDPITTLADTIRWIYDNRDRLGHSRVANSFLFGINNYYPQEPRSVIRSRL